MVLNLEEVILTEDPLVLARNLLRAGLVTLEQPAGYLAAEAARERDQPLRVFGQQGLVDARLVVIALEVRQAGELDQVAIALQVLDEQDQVMRIAVGSSFLLVAGTGGAVDLLADE